ncbi:MAG: hypothetical protein Q7J16_10055 [Candidatus Cloacimonadales bacterium]|nr:hypothetical protein [Candidatus Cloacimonadales bacterium]
MTENLNINEIKQKAYNSINQDGLTEVAAGIMFLFLSIMLYLDVFLDQEVTVFFIMPIIFIGPFLQGMRKKFTYPRVGYANLVTLRRTRFVIILVLLALIPGIFAVVKFIKMDFHADLFYFAPLVIGLFLSAVHLYRLIKYKIKRYCIYSIIAFLVTIIAYLFPMRGLVRVLIILTSVAIFQIPIGLITFVNFLRRTPLLPDEIASPEKTE